MVTVATCSFAWSLTRWVDTLALHYTVPLVVTATIWILTIVFASGVIWEMTAQLMAKPKPPTPPGPTQPPGQPGGTPRQPPAPIQPPQPIKPPKKQTAAETTLVDLAPVETTLVDMEPVGHWRPAVSESAAKDN